MRKKPKEKLQKPKISLKILNGLMLAAIFLIGAAYLVGVNDLAIKSFVLQGERKKLKQIEAEASELELKAMALSSFNVLSQKISGLGMVKIDKIDYLKVPGAVAMKK